MEEPKEDKHRKYWTHFQTVSFAVFLSGDFHSQLIIPRRFTENIRKELPKNVTLRGPSVLSDKWEVQLSTDDNATSLVGENWKEFVVAYSLKEEDILVFKYKNNSYFKVSVFDGQSCWVEKESSYFVKKSVGSKIDSSENRQEKESYTIMQSFPPGFPETIASKKGKSEYQGGWRHQNEGIRYPREKMCTELAEDSEEELEEEDDTALAEDSEDELREKDDTEWRPPKKSGEDQDLYIAVPLQIVQDKSRTQFTKRSTKPLTWPSCMKAKRGAKNVRSLNDPITRKRVPTVQEKQRAKQQARRELTQESFLMVLSSSYIHRRLSLPKKWTNKFVSPCRQCFRLSNQDGMEWRVKYYFSEKRGTGMFVGGWTHFVRDNRLHEFDVCVFKLAGREEGEVCLDVKIIRVTED